MERGLVAVALVLALDASGDELPRVVVLDVTVNDSPGPARQRAQSLAAAIGEQLLTELGRNGRVEVMGTSDIATVLGLERQRELLGCSESSTSCLAEMGGALGARYIVATALSRAGTQLRLDIKLMRADHGQAIARQGDTLSGEDSIFPQVAKMARELSDALTRDLTPPGAAVSGAARPARPLPWVGIGLGVVAAMVGVALLAIMGSHAGDLQRDIALYDIGEAQRARSRIYSERDSGLAFVVSGAIVAVASTLWLVLQRAPE